ncbi:MAG: helix-turn-helix transcriptional regulator [Bacteroidia bacterium]
MYNLINEKSTPLTQLPKNSNLVNFSEFKELYSNSPFRSFSIKYVIEGYEKYTVNGKVYPIQTGQYLLANHFCEGSIEIDSRKAVKGLCIDIAPEILSEVVACFRQPDAPICDLALDTFFNTSHFLENQYAAQETQLGNCLLTLAKEVAQNPHLLQNVSPAFYFNLAEKMIADHLSIYKQLQNVKTVKIATKKDLFRRVSKGKLFIDQYFTHSFDIAEVAQEATLSEYHFFRLFKNMYQLSPYQYLLQKRLHYSLEMLKQGNTSITEIAENAGFCDVHAFSKAFKKHFGASPSAFLHISPTAFLSLFPSNLCGEYAHQEQSKKW